MLRELTLRMDLARANNVGQVHDYRNFQQQIKRES
jgi:hypothetical protein